MMIHPLIALLAWIPIGLFLLWRLPVRVAILANFVGGWAVLPTAYFPAGNASFPYWVVGACLPSVHLVTKATATGLTFLLSILLFDRRGLARFRPSVWDIPMLVWCVVPLVSGIANGQGWNVSLRAEGYQVLAWGMPYVAGRIYFADGESLLLAAKAFVIAGVAYVPICLVEIFTGPQIYAWLYGYEPYRWIGAQRYFGYRPVGMLEDGNQLGIWMASSALIAIWLWRRGLVKAVAGIPIAWIGCALFAVTVLCQSGASILLLIGLLPFGFLRRRKATGTLTVLVLLGIVALTSLRLANVISLRSLVKHNGAANAGAEFLIKIGRGSFGWRLAQDEKHVGVALERPILGTGAWDWWKGSSSRPWGLWLLAFGMYGAVGLIALQCLQLIPVTRAVWHPLARAETERFRFDLRRALAAVVLMSAIDNLMDGAMILPVVVLIGGLSDRATVASAATEEGVAAIEATAIRGA